MLINEYEKNEYFFGPDWIMHRELLLPESRSEDEQHRKNLQPAYHHQKDEHPFADKRNPREVIDRTKSTKSGPNIAQAGDTGADGRLHAVAHARQNKGANAKNDYIEHKETQHGALNIRTDGL